MNPINELGHTSFSVVGLSAGAKAAGYTIERVVIGHLYPKNGNVFNPTPRLRFTVYLNGGIVGTYFFRRDAIELANGIVSGKY